MTLDKARAVTAQMLKEDCHGVAIESMLLSLPVRRKLPKRLASASHDVCAKGFSTYFDVRIFHLIVL